MVIMPPVTPIKALVTCAGAMPACAVINALKRQKELSVTVLAVDANPLSAGLHLADAKAVVPPFTDPGYVDAVLALAVKDGVKIVFPIMDEELLAFAEARAKFERAGIALVTNDPAVVRLARDKKLTYDACREKGLDVPATVPVSQRKGASLPPFPLIVKPRSGRGSLGVATAGDAEELDFYAKRCPDGLIQERVSGQEYTIDVVTDPGGRVLAVVPKARLETKAGMQVKGRVVRDQALLDYGARIAAAFGLTLRFNVQCVKRADGRLALIEINAKFPASLPFTVAAGVNAPLMLTRMLVMKETLAPRIGDFKDGLTMMRYWQEVYA